jgi:CRP/FNR family transcriptional regulator
MYSNLFSHIRKFVSLTAEEEQVLSQHLQHQAVKKKEHLLKEGKVCHAQYFILKGCCRMYLVNEKGVEQTTQFGIENWWLADFMSFLNQSPSQFNIQAIENMEVACWDRKSEETLFEQIPQLERYFRIVLQKSNAASQWRIRYLFTQAGDERYHHFNKLYPEFVQRVPQYMLASYLGFSPEFLSKIRAGKI